MTSLRSLVLLAGVAVLASLAVSHVENADLADEPAPADLAALEAGEPAANRHVRLGHHLRVYHYLAFEYEAGEPAGTGTGEPGGDTVVTEVYYPVISVDHPYARALMQLEQEYGSLARVPSDVALPELESFRVLARTTEFGRAADLPAGIAVREALDGVLRKDPLTEAQVSDFELALAFPALDRDALLVLDVGEAPMSPREELWLAGIGGGLLLLGGLGVAASRGRDEQGVGASQGGHEPGAAASRGEDESAAAGLSGAGGPPPGA